MDVRAHRGVSRQRLHVRSALSALLVLCPLSGAARADEVAALAPTRALKLGASAQYLVGNPFAGRSSNAGPGLAATYEFLLSPRFALGIALGYKQYFGDRKSTRLNSSHQIISYAVFCLQKKKKLHHVLRRP